MVLRLEIQPLLLQPLDQVQTIRLEEILLEFTILMVIWMKSGFLRVLLAGFQVSRRLFRSMQQVQVLDMIWLLWTKMEIELLLILSIELEIIYPICIMLAETSVSAILLPLPYSPWEVETYSKSIQVDK